MYIAELHGKLPSNVERKEDILTSNVFSFFKYADRNVYLKELMTLLKIDVNDMDLVNAEFIFWPNYDDFTQPDMVLIVGDYYLLWEAKYFSDFGEKEIKPKSQVIREIVGGMNEAKTLGKQFFYVVITADYVCRENKFTIVPKEYRRYFKWVNWHSISYLLLRLLEQSGEDLPNYHFANDLYRLLAKKNLRSFQSFIRLKGMFVTGKMEKVFFSSESAIFRGNFLGFTNVLSQMRVQRPGEKIFFTRQGGRNYFQPSAYEIIKQRDVLFYKGRG